MNKTNLEAYGLPYIQDEQYKALERTGMQSDNLKRAAMEHARLILDQQTAACVQFNHSLQDIATRMLDGHDVYNDATDYIQDSIQRSCLFWDTLREAGNIHREHAKSGAPPVLVYDYEMIMDGRKLCRPVNYALVRIRPEGGVEADPKRRPYIIIDPRAGHGAGIGGSKSDSQVGVAMREGHPVYFVIFFPDPEPTQVLADVCAAEADFIRTVTEHHPAAPKPVVIGNCQGGWSTMLLCATNPDLTGPIVINGAPMSYWAGELGKNPMRYFGGLAGGVLPAALFSDLGAGRFDGANLVLNFETLNPANTWWSKYYELYRNVDTGAQRFLSFERWWSGFYFMNASEIRWIIENLFVGNRLSRGGVMLDPRTYVNLRHIRSPIIVFASLGDNITPPQQALNWIADAYSDTHEIKACGQRIVYLLHDEIGHLGIFVSSKVAKKQHRNIVSTLKAIEALAPGLYEMVIEEKEGEGLDAVYTVSFQNREIEDVLQLDDERNDEEMFAAISKISRMSGEFYDIMIRPWLRAVANPMLVENMTQTHPLRLRRRLISDENPGMLPVKFAAEKVREQRKPAADNNIFSLAEQVIAGCVEQSWKQFRLFADAWVEMSFLTLYGSPLLMTLGEPERNYETSLAEFDIYRLPQVQLILSRVGEGGFVDAVVRILVLLATVRRSVRQSRLERSAEVMRQREPFSDLSEAERNRIVHEQSIVVDLVPDVALATLPVLLPDMHSRTQALEIVDYVLGPPAELEEATVNMLNEVKTALGIGEPDIKLTA